MISFFCGLPLGSEGPAVLIGTSLGKMSGEMSKKHTAWSRYIMTGGAGAGFAVATGAPLSGILFSLEEIHKRFTPMLVLSVSMSVISATFVNETLCSLMGLDPMLLDVAFLSKFELKQTLYLLLLGVLIAVAVGIFDSSITLYNRFTQKYKKVLTNPVKLVIVFVATGILGFVLSEGIYSGHDTILDMLSNNEHLWFIVLLLAVRLLMMLLATDSGATGGIFIPTLAIGSLAGALCAKLLTFMGMPDELFAPTVLLGMCAFIGGTLRAPLTASVLFVELTGQFSSLFFVALVVFTVNFITELLNQKSFYDRVLENIEEAQNHGKKPVIGCFEMKVSNGSFVIGKAVRDIMWPLSAVVIGITRAEEDKEDMDNDGEKKLFVGDTVVIRARYYDAEEIKQTLGGLVGTDHEIKEVEMKK